MAADQGTYVRYDHEALVGILALEAQRAGAVVIGEETNFVGGSSWLEELGVEIIVLDDPSCIELLGTFIAEHPELWHEDIGL